MSVEDRLRRGLGVNAEAFIPEAEARLAAVHRRYHARRWRTAAATVTVTVAVAFAGSLLRDTTRNQPTDPTEQPALATTSTEGYPGTRIPDSNWRKAVTRAEYVQAHATRGFLADNLGNANRVATTLSFIGTVYSQSVRSLGTWSVGDAGTLTYDSRGRLVLTSTAPGCRGCVMTLHWRIDRNRLILSGFDGTPDDRMAQVMLEGVWTRVHS